MHTNDIADAFELVLGYRSPRWLHPSIQLAMLARRLVETTPDGHKVSEYAIDNLFPNWYEGDKAYDPRHDALFMVLGSLDDMGLSCESIAWTWKTAGYVACAGSALMLTTGAACTLWR
jgi:hypothetical protein